MQTTSSIATEIDAIIQRAMAEYTAAHGVDPFAPEEESIIRDEAEVIEEPAASSPDPIPTNSNSILVEETTSRFSSAIWYDNIKSKVVTLAGLGGIGSYVAFLLARLDPLRIIIYDDDIVEAANMSGQLYSCSDLGRPKVSAMVSMMNYYAHYYAVLSFQEKFTEESDPTDIMICGFDNMEARRIFYTKWKQWVAGKEEEAKKECLFIDGRLAAENFQVLCITGDDVFNQAKYEKDFLFSDNEADETICSYKQTTFMANMIGSIIVNLFVNFCANQCNPLIPRDLPFYTEYTAETMFFKVIA